MVSRRKSITDTPVKRGDVCLVDFNPTRGHEIYKQRPAIVVSNNRFNESSGLCVVCPVTDAFGKTSVVHIPIFKGEGGLRKDPPWRAHCGQIRTIDQAERVVRRLGTLSAERMKAIEFGLRLVLDLRS